MVEVTENTLEQLETIAEKTDTDFDEVREIFKGKYESTEERSQEVDEETIERLAVRQTKAKILGGNRVPTDDIEMLTIGGDLVNGNDGDMFFGSAVVDENPDEEAGQAKLAAVRIFDEELASEVYNAFSEVGNIVTGNFAVSEGEVHRNRLQVSNSDDTEFEVHEPDNRMELVQEIRNTVPETSIATIADDLSATYRDDDGEQRVDSSDIYRIEADVYDGYKNPDTGVGIYTLRDESVFDDEDVAQSPVHNEEEANENATPGLTCFFDANQMEWGTSAVVEFYGTIEKNDEDGTVQMSADGAVPIMPNEDGFDGYTDSSDEEKPREKRSSSNVDRQKI